LSAAEERHVRFAGSVWEEYGTFLAEQEESAGRAKTRPASVLPYTKEGITSAVELLLDIGEGRTPCSYIDTRSIPADALDAMRKALGQLEEFADNPKDLEK
jgi:hypothetical protein